MIDAFVKAIQLFFIFWIHMLWGAACVFAVAWVFIQVVLAVIAQS